MRILHILMVFVAISILALFGSCSSGSNASGPVTPSAVPVGIEFLNGATGVDPDASFQYTFDAKMDTSTVTSSSFFIVIGAEGTPLPGIVTNTSGNTFVYDPDDTLPYETVATVQITADNKRSDGTSVTPFSASFTTAAEGETPSRLISSIEVNNSAVDLNDLPITSAIKVTFFGPEAALTDVQSLIAVTSQDSGAAVTGGWNTLDENGNLVDHASSLYFQFTPAPGYSYCDRVAVVIPTTLVSNNEDVTTTFTTLYSYASPFATATELRQNFSTCWSPQPVAQGGGTFPGVVDENGLFGLNFSTATQPGQDTDPNYSLEHVPMLDVDNAIFTVLMDNFAITNTATAGGLYLVMTFMASQEAQTPLVRISFGATGTGGASNGACLVWLGTGTNPATNIYNGPGNNNECLLNDPDPTMNLRFELVGTTLNMYAAKSCTTDCTFSDPITLPAPYTTPLDLSQYGYDATTGDYILSLQPYFLDDVGPEDAYINFDVVSITFE